MEFQFTKHPGISLRRYVWHNKICIGFVDQKIRENKDIDWDALRADKTKVLKGKDRWYSLYSAIAFPNTFVSGQYRSAECAAKAILEKHFESAP
jgi:hypothetical protein|tara:strand:- start:165 stop:446 length:282 start_codon:yes stop_codon:yes gene_type:complete